MLNFAKFSQNDFVNFFYAGSNIYGCASVYMVDNMTHSPITMGLP